MGAGRGSAGRGSNAFEGRDRVYQSDPRCDHSGRGRVRKGSSDNSLELGAYVLNIESVQVQILLQRYKQPVGK